MTTHDRIDLTCPACATEFGSRTWMSTTFIGKRTDFHPIAAGFPPLPLLIHTCPDCGFTGWDDDFEGPTEIPSGLARRIRAELGPRVRDRPPDSGTRYELAARIAEWRGAEPETIAHAYLQAAWCCVDEGQTGNESRYRRAAIEFFRKALESEQGIPADRALVVTYLIGELYRRVGDTGQAREWFDRVIRQGHDDEDARSIVRLAQQQRDVPREMLAEE